MLIAAFIVLTCALSVGLLLALCHLRADGAKAPPWMLAVLHGILAAVGLVCLVLALRGPVRGLATGTSSFGLIATGLFVFAGLVGGGIAAAHFRGKKLPGTLIGIHAALAVGGFAIFAAYVFAG